MYTTCKDSFIDSINSPVLRSSTQGSISFSNVGFLLNSIPESIVIISEKGIILEINSATSRLFGWTKDEIVSIYIYIIYYFYFISRIIYLNFFFLLIFFFFFFNILNKKRLIEKILVFY